MKTSFKYFTLIVQDVNGKWKEYVTSYDKEILSMTMDKLIRKGYDRTEVAVVSKESAFKDYIGE